MKLPSSLSSAFSTLLARRVRQGLCVCALAAGLTAGSALSPLPVAGPPSADASSATPDANEPQAQPRGIPDLKLPDLPHQSRGRATEESRTATGLEGGTGIPATALDAYKKAERTLSSARPSCHLPWQLVAGIGRVESVHASGYGLRADGSTAKPIRGPRLDGKQFALIRDTDGGRWDGDAEFDRAIGPMQFIPSTWATWGADGNGDGVNDPHNIYDAALATGHYLCAGGRDLDRPADLDRAILSYNNSREYVNAVRDWMRTYQGHKVTATPDDAPATPHHPDPADAHTPAATSQPRPARTGSTVPSRAELTPAPEDSATVRPGKAVEPTTPSRPAGKPAKKPDTAPDRNKDAEDHAVTEHRVVTRLEPIGGESLGDRTVGKAFERRAQVSVLDAHGHGVADVKVTYRITGSTGTYFPGRATTVTVTTDRRGIAVAPVLQAGDRPGPLRVTATAPGQRGPVTGTFMATVRPAPVPTADRLELLTSTPLPADINSRFLNPPQVRATARNKPAAGIRITATLFNGDGEEEGSRQATVGPYFEGEHGDPVRTLALPGTDAEGRLTLPQLFTDEHPGTYTLRLTTPEGISLDLPLTVGETGPGLPAS
ncbi:lytic murein transglycosylase [Streptomyces celluloflavus]|uniref:lytic murein transglycosylase n=1 Tax=Streptomyces celluloflavus TaxID=58344 RepID=UPI0036776620